MAKLSSEGIGHRDLKPDNLFWLDGVAVVGDFGLVTYPEKDPVTEAGRRLGPVDYMAPEMRADADRAEAGPTDVWALAKILWTLLTNHAHPLPGPHRPDDVSYSLEKLLKHPRAAEFDRLLAAATRLPPGETLRASSGAPGRERTPFRPDELAALMLPPTGVAEKLCGADGGTRPRRRTTARAPSPTRANRA